eukprot:TRINITY_DN508_c0_g1_i3.p1 TRINITY_DN508_c0_g1~~TRINITY_DN508_c0_g1_i3.p1  ORF type:complete len:197 (+),score=23.74 TRINITY_DN508_c0_g1_i3:51-593(+)
MSSAKMMLKKREGELSLIAMICDEVKQRDTEQQQQLPFHTATHTTILLHPLSFVPLINHPPSSTKQHILIFNHPNIPTLFSIPCPSPSHLIPSYISSSSPLPALSPITLLHPVAHSSSQISPLSLPICSLSPPSPFPSSSSSFFLSLLVSDFFFSRFFFSLHVDPASHPLSLFIPLLVLE